MKKLLIASVAIASLLGAATAASANTVSSPIVVGAVVDSQCGLGNQTGGGVIAPSTPIALGSIVDGNGFLNTAIDQSIDFGNVWCNGPSTVSLTVTPLTTGAFNSDPGSFLAGVDMVVDNSDGGGSVLVYVGNPASVSSSNGTTNGVASASPGAFESGTGQYQNARLHLAYPAGHPGNDRPLAGAWSGLVTLTATAN